MKKSLILVLAAFAVLCGCIATNLNTSRTKAEITTLGDIGAIKKLFADNAAALSAGDMSALGRLYEQDAIQLPPNSPAVVGWGAIRSKLERELEGIKVVATIEVVEVCTTESWAFARGTYRMVTTPLNGGEQEITVGNWLNILRRQPDSSWKIARSTWSSEE